MIGKFRGTLYGVLVGDCCGAPFETEEILSIGSRLVLRKYFEKLQGPYFAAPKKPYTDDTALTISVARSLIAKKTIDQKDLATNFVQEYYKNPRRGYGEAVQAVFVKLQKSKIIDPLAPAREQFDGLGSYGNGGAMRIAPITLLCHNKSAEDLVALSKKSVEITHTHAHGINGAILQAFAIRQLLRMTHNKNAEINTDEFLNGLEQKMKAIESDDAPVYCKALNEIARLLRIDPSDEQVVNKLGNSTSALRSVPTAIYCFLKTCKPIDNDQNKNPLRNAIESAITLGGDTDTIASMTGALAGAYYGESFIPENILKHCEGFDEIKLLSEQLYDASQRD